MKMVAPLALALSCSTAVLVRPPAASAGSAGEGPLADVPMTGVKLDGFWKQQVKLVTEKWIPHCVRQMEAGGEGQELLNLVATGRALRGEEPGPYRGAPWSDAYIYNTMEAICLALEVAPDGDADLAAAQAALRAKVEEWIPIILAAQQPDGYIHSFHVLKKKPRFTVIADHEFYVMGYLFEMGIAHHRLTGGKDRRLYDAARKCADLLCDTFGPAPKRTWKNGHPGMEYALCRLGEYVDGVEGAGRGARYVALARHFLDHQHTIEPNPYNQSDRPAVEMSDATGHAVRATYFYTAMTDIALLQNDAAFRAAAGRLWASAVDRKHYLTGGVGASHRGEAFAGDYELPNNGYCESCASCGLSFWADRMHRLHADAAFRDVQERVLYNNVLGSLERTGTNFYYQNPLKSKLPRTSWHACPCCVGNIPRALIAIKDQTYSVNGPRDALYVNHYVAGEGDAGPVGGGPLRIAQSTRYPWEGRVELRLTPAAPAGFTLALRIPNRTESKLYRAEPDSGARFTVKVNGESHAAEVRNGYALVRRTWKAGDRVTLELPMDPQRVRCDERVEANRGRVAVQRGPIVYSFEDADNRRPVRASVLDPAAGLKASWRGDLLGGVMVLEAGGLTGIPNFARLNRGGASQVWMIEDREKAGVVDTPATMADLTVSFARPNMDPSAANDGRSPGDGRDLADGHFDFWPHLGTAEWLQYEFERPTEIRSCKVWWFDDTGRGGCRIPASWRLMYRKDDGAWEPVRGASGYPVAKDKPSDITFDAITTRALRLEVQLQKGFSAGVHEWSVQ
jgi:hypothetical protein